MEYPMWCGILRKKIYILELKWKLCWMSCSRMNYEPRWWPNLAQGCIKYCGFVGTKCNTVIHSNCLWLLLGWREKCNMCPSLVRLYVSNSKDVIFDPKQHLLLYQLVHVRTTMLYFAIIRRHLCVHIFSVAKMVYGTCKTTQTLAVMNTTPYVSNSKHCDAYSVALRK